LESLLEDAHLKLSSLVSDLLGVSARRMLQALADGATHPATVAALADQRLRATPAQLCDALGACTTLHPVYRRLLHMVLAELRLIDEQIGRLDQEMASLLATHDDAVHRLADVTGLGADSAQQIIAEVGVTAATFPSPKHLASWMGACPGSEESAGKNYSHPDATCPQSGRERRREGQGHDLRDRLSTPRPTPRARPSHRGHRPPALSSHLEDSPPGPSL
jgi:transposase